MADPVLFDSDILIDAGRGKEEANTCLNLYQKNHKILISVISQMELMIGCRDKQELRKLDHFLRRFSIFELNENISRISVELLYQYRLSHGLLIADSLIAATSIVLAIPLLTKNQRDYIFIDRLTLLPYPTNT